MQARPKVSVCMITYQHAPFIERAIESVLAQRATFRIELVIGEDDSPDSTSDLIRRFESDERVTIRSRFNSPNLGMQPNFELTLSECRGQYVALLEGDDYWCDPAKLQRQVDFLDAHPDYAICFHPVDVLQQGRLVADTRTRPVAETTDIHDLAQGNFMHTCSVVFRAGLFETFPPTFRSASAGDFFLHMLNARFGRIRRLPQTMAVYRVHAGGAWSAQDDVDLKILNYLEAMIGCFSSDVDAILERRHRETAFKSFARRIDEPGSQTRFQRCLRYGDSTLVEELRRLLLQERQLANGVLRRAADRFKAALGRS